MPTPPMISTHGAIVTIGLVTNDDRWELVIPVATDSVAHGPLTSSADIGIGVQTNVIAPLMNCLSSATSLKFIQVEGMVDGDIPARRDFVTGVFAGARGPNPLPCSVSALVAWYGDPAHTLPSGRTRVGKSFLSGIDSADVVGDHVQAVLGGLLQVFGFLLMDGFLGGDGVTTYYRVVAASDRIAGQPLCNTVAVSVREYVATQRRRLTPH